MPKEIPILYQAEMVRAYLAGHKTQTRRLLSAANCLVNFEGLSQKGFALDAFDWQAASLGQGGLIVGSRRGNCLITPRAKVGDALWGRETWRTATEADRLPPRKLTPAHRIWYEADSSQQPGAGKLRPSIFMPRAASRITQPLTSVHIERLQDISEADALAEGVRPHDGGGMFHIEKQHLGLNARESYANLFDSINGPGSASQNPWVLVYEFPACTSQAN